MQVDNIQDNHRGSSMDYIDIEIDYLKGQPRLSHRDWLMLFLPDNKRTIQRNVQDKLDALHKQVKELWEQYYALPGSNIKGKTFIEATIDYKKVKIKELEQQLRTIKNHGKETINNGSSITEEDKVHAKEVPIETLYSGRTRQSGKNMVGICPFHTEKSGSFTINLVSNRFHCFSCSVDGDSIDYIMKIDGLDFIQAVKQLSGN